MDIGVVTATHLVTYQTGKLFRNCTELNQDGNLIINANWCMEIFTIEGYSVTRIRIPAYNLKPHFEVTFAKNFILLIEKYTRFTVFTDLCTKIFKFPSSTECAGFDRDGNLYTDSMNLGNISVYSNDMIFQREIDLKHLMPIHFIQTNLFKNTIVILKRGRHIHQGVINFYEFSWTRIDSFTFSENYLPRCRDFSINSSKNIILKKTSITQTKIKIMTCDDQFTRTIDCVFIEKHDVIHLTDDYQLIVLCRDGCVEVYQLTDHFY